MADRPPVTAETLQQMARELVATPLPEADLPAVTDLVNALYTDMRAFLAVPLGDFEPVVIYRAEEPS